MRLICPNCGAQYEVAEDAIPAEGRDVQCSNCAHTWFERPGASEAEETGETYVPPEPAPEVRVAPPAPEPEPEPTPEDDGDGDGDESDGDDADEGIDETPADDTPADGPDGPPARQALSPSVAEILREEAEREATARKTEDARRKEARLETQADLGLTDGPAPKRDPAPVADPAPESEPYPEAEAEPEPEPENAPKSTLSDRIARLREESAAEHDIPAATAGRRDLLPDIEEINSSLRSTADRAETVEDDGPASGRKRRGGFRLGFGLVVLVAVLALLAYVLAPQISDLVPALADPLDGYVDWVDALRLRLDLALQDMLDEGA